MQIFIRSREKQLLPLIELRQGVMVYALSGPASRVLGAESIAGAISSCAFIGVAVGVGLIFSSLV